jgi:hypothetical protein
VSFVAQFIRAKLRSRRLVGHLRPCHCGMLNSISPKWAVPATMRSILGNMSPETSEAAEPPQSVDVFPASSSINLPLFSCEDNHRRQWASRDSSS